MATRRKAWSDLTPAYRSRLERSGISRSDFERGENIRAARGHAVTPERLTGYRRRADELGIGFIAPEYDEFFDALTKEEQSEIARDYVLGFMTKGKATEPRIKARMRFERWIYSLRGQNLSREDWAAYRALYRSHFGGKKA